jgi:hypothetical protein
MPGRKYTAEQNAARLAYTRAWRKRNREKIRAYDTATANRRRKLARKRRSANREKLRMQALMWSRKHRAQRRAYSRAYRAKQLALNPNWAREKMQAFGKANPTYWTEAGQRRRLRVAWRKFTSTCAANRRKTPNPTQPEHV